MMFSRNLQQTILNVNYLDKDLGNGKEMIYPYMILFGHATKYKIHFIIVMVDSLNFTLEKWVREFEK